MFNSSVLLSTRFQIKVPLITEHGTSVRDPSSASDRLIFDDVAVCLRHNQNYARDLLQALPVARNIENG